MKEKVVFVWVAALCLLWAGCEQMGGSVPMLEVQEQANEEEGEVPVYVKLAAIEIATLPDTLYYSAGNKFDPTGLEVDGVYYRYIGYDEEPPPETEPDEAVTERLPRSRYRITAPGASAAGGRSYDVTVRCDELPPRTFQVYISAASATATLSKMEIANPSEIKKNYELGQAFDTSNLTVTATYSDKTTESVPGASCQVVNYDRRKRGTQTVTLRINSRPLGGGENIPVTVRVPSSAVVTANSINNAPGYIGWQDKDKSQYYRPAYIKGTPLTSANLYLRVNVKVNGETVTLSTHQDGGITDADTITDYNYNTAGLQQPKLQIDDAKCELEVFYMDAEPEVYFDYGFMRHNKDTTGKGFSAGKYYVKQGEPLVLSPIRFLIGYDENNADIGVTSCVWEVDEVETQTGTTETFKFTPSAAKTYKVEVTVTGRNFVTGQSVTKAATTEVVSFTGNVTGSAGKPLAAALKNFAPGQFTEGGTGYGWSLGTFGGYEMWPVSVSTITIQGNGFETWSEPGVIWVQEDKNGNGIPDEMWYELTGSQDTSIYKSEIKRRYAIKHFASASLSIVTIYDQPVRRTYWTDSTGKCGAMFPGWPDKWGVDSPDDGVWVQYTGTIVPMDGDLSGYVDVYNAKDRSIVTVDKNKAVCADGSKANINNIRFVKVQTGVFSYGGIFGDISTEIYSATGLGQQTNFPLP